MPGRRNGEFFSDLIAWDNEHYAYIGMRTKEVEVNGKKTYELEPCSQSTSIPFYFATLEELNLTDKLHTVSTVDNNEHGITMKMFDFNGDTNKLSQTDVTKGYFNGDYSNTQGLLYNSLEYSGDDDAGYPRVKTSNKSIKDMYANAEEVNHLFIDSIYNSSGYFEYDSCQNFATLNGNTGGDFTVYRELGTTNAKTKPTLQHGQFFPYNTIQAGVYSTSSPKNLYDMDALASNNASGKLDDSDPRKYEKLHLINDPNYFFGMEMSASFVQTVSGLDAWGHDIIFDFTGDDDFWLYVDGELILDLGGTHSAEYGRVNFRTGEVFISLVNSGNTARIETKTTLKDIFRANYEARGITDIESKLDEIFEDNGHGQYIFKDYTTHTMRAFYMERGAGASNLHMRFNLASVTPGHVVVSKNISGDGADVLDTDFVEYPFQIYYTLPDNEDGTEGEEKLLGNDDEHIRVVYQNSNQPVTFVKKYRPPGFAEEDAYENIYFINPKKNAEIAFPDETISYRIVECAVDSSVYDKVLINGNPVPPGRTEIKGTLKSYSSEQLTAQERPTISFDNHVEDNVIKDLFITKKLYDENDNEITDDPTTFDFRLYLSTVDVNANDLPLANMYKYYVISADKKMCRYDSESKRFVETDLTYSREAVKALKAYSNTDIEDDDVWQQFNTDHGIDVSKLGITDDDVIFVTSGFGSISKIPAGYTICVPSLPVGTVFKVTENVKSGYGLIGFERIFGEKVNADNTTTSIPSYHEYDGNPINVGKVIAEENPQIEVHNKKGFGLTVNKKWSDLNITTAHAPIYVAVYVDGKLLENSVRQIASPSTSAYYFWTSLKPYTDGKPRDTYDGYEVREVTISSKTPVIADDGTVTGYGTVTPVSNKGKINLTAVRTAEATPDGETNEKNYDYVVSYEHSTEEGSTRTDTITNTREGGIAIRLFEWKSTDPLQNGKFTLHNSSGQKVGSYSSDADGMVTILYSFEPGKLYTLTQTSAPKGYVGLRKKLCFKVNTDESVSLYYPDGTTAWGKTDDEDLNWANEKAGDNGLTAFIDVYNKPFNFKIIKTDGEDPSIKLGSAHFALYKQANTTISGYVKNKEPMTGFEDMVTVNGEIDVCGGNSGRSIDPGANGSVYFLTETQAPFNYTQLNEDIIFRVSALGIPSLISDAYNGQLYETDDSFVYTLSVPNTKEDPDLVVLTIDKQVNGAYGNKTKDFTFTISIENAASDINGYVWAKNGAVQPAMARTGGTFTMKHSDRVEIALPVNVNVTITEDNEGYTTRFRLNDESPVSKNQLEFKFTGNTKVLVTNTLDGDVPTGVSSSMGRAVFLVALSALPIGYILYFKRKRKYRS